MLDYGVNGGAQGQSIVYATWQEPLKVPAVVDERVIKYLNQSGIDRVISGHQPYGDAPMVIRASAPSSNGGIDVISADTSWCSEEGPNYRGKAVSEVYLDLTDIGHVGDKGRAYVHGAREDGTEYGYCIDEDPWVGTLLTDRWWVHTRLEDSTCGGGLYGLCRAAEDGRGFAVEYGEVRLPATRPAASQGPEAFHVVHKASADTPHVRG